MRAKDGRESMDLTAAAWSQFLVSFGLLIALMGLAVLRMGLESRTPWRDAMLHPWRNRDRMAPKGSYTSPSGLSAPYVYAAGCAMVSIGLLQFIGNLLSL